MMLSESLTVPPNHGIERHHPLMGVLRAATRSAHHRIDHHPTLAPLARANLTMAQYQRILQCSMAIHVPLQSLLEDALARMEFTENFRVSPRLSWLKLDFEYFGLTPDADVSAFLSSGWQSFRWPRLDTPAALVGSLYVVEGSTLGGQVIARLLKQHLGISPETGGRFYAGHGPLTQDRWSDFIAFAQSTCLPEDILMACDAALDTFEAIDRALSRLDAPLHALA